MHILIASYVGYEKPTGAEPVVNGDGNEGEDILDSLSMLGIPQTDSKKPVVKKKAE